MTKNYSLQALRAIAALLVVFAHSMTQINMAKDIDGQVGYTMRAFESLGGLGVYVFFIISGYIMSYTTNTKQNGVYVSLVFLKKRFLRVYPVYWICLTMLVIGWGMGVFLKSHEYSISKIISSYLLIPFVDSESDSINPMLSQGWTLMYEVFFYLTFSLLLLFNLCGFKKILYLLVVYLLFYLFAHLNIVKFDAFNIFFKREAFFLFIVGMILFEFEKLFILLYWYYLLLCFLVLLFPRFLKMKIS